MVDFIRLIDSIQTHRHLQKILCQHKLAIIIPLHFFADMPHVGLFGSFIIKRGVSGTKMGQYQYGDVAGVGKSSNHFGTGMLGVKSAQLGRFVHYFLHDIIGIGRLVDKSVAVFDGLG